MFKFLDVLFDCVWKLFSISWPGLSFTIGHAFLAVTFAHVALSLVTSLFDLRLPSFTSSGRSADYSTGDTVRGGNSRYLTIPEQRRLDSK